MSPDEDRGGPKKPEYRMYVDEFGDAQVKNFAGVNTRFLGVTGVILNLEDVSTTLHPALEKIKTEYLPSHHPDSPAILHRTDMVRNRGHFAPLQDDSLRFWFDLDLQQLIEECGATVITVAIDKKEHCDRYSNPDHPYHYVMKCLIERYVWFLGRRASCGDVMVESRNPNQNGELNREFRQVVENGTWLVHRPEIAERVTSRELKFRTKGHNVLGLQMADIFGKASMGEMFSHKNIDIGCGSFDKFIASLLTSEAYFRDGGGRIDNYGKKWIN